MVWVTASRMQLQVLDVNYKMGWDEAPIISIFGKDAEGGSRTIDVRNFRPYFYARVEDGHIRDSAKMVGDRGLRVEVVDRFRPVGYQSKTTKMLKMTTVSPKDVRWLRDEVRSMPYVQEVYEADILFNSRFMADTGITGMSWIDVDGFEVDYWDIRRMDKEGDAPLRILSVDIEVLAPEDGSFPDASSCPVIIVSMSFNKPYRNNLNMVLVAKEYECYRDDVMFLRDERAILNELHNIIRDYDPDIITGYNIEEFDIPYLDMRFRVSGIPCNFGKDGSQWFIQAIGGKRETKIAGRVVIDTLPMVRRNYSLAQYTLKNVSKELLHLEKLDVPPSKMREYWFSGDERFEEFVRYARRDSVLGMMLLTDLGMLEKYVALSKVSGILLQTVITGGQSVMLEFMLLQRFNRADRVMRMKPLDLGFNADKREVEYEGAYVSEPEVGLHEHIILTDMQSLYPSMIISQNICPTTVIIDEDLGEGMFHVDSNGGRFANQDVLQGILPQMLDEVLKKRLAVKAQMKKTEDKHERAVLDAIQYAFKIVINAAYGWCGYKRSRLFNITVASAVTAYGRDTIAEVRAAIDGIEDLEANGKVFNFHVLYTDTDSAYVRLICNGEITIADADVVGNEVARIVSAPMPYPMKLNYEGYARRALFLAKKRYVMWLMEIGRDGNMKDKIKAKGIETVRRDWCKLTAETLQKCLDLILKEGDIEGAARYGMEVIRQMEHLTLDDEDILEKLVLTRNYHKDSSGYKNKPAHIKLLDRMKARGEQTPGLGDRMSYFIVVGREPLSERAETLEFIKQSGKRIDTSYYINKQLIKPLLRIFEALDIDMRTGKKVRKEVDLFSL